MASAFWTWGVHNPAEFAAKSASISSQSLKTHFLRFAAHTSGTGLVTPIYISRTLSALYLLQDLHQPIHRHLREFQIEPRSILIDQDALLNRAQILTYQIAISKDLKDIFVHWSLPFQGRRLLLLRHKPRAITKNDINLAYQLEFGARQSPPLSVIDRNHFSVWHPPAALLSPSTAFQCRSSN